MSELLLSPQQLEVICALSTGATLTAAAEQAGVHRNTICHWRRNLIPFQHALASAQYDRALLYREKIEDLVDLAVATLRDLLADLKASASVRLKAALAVVNLAVKPPEPKRQVELLIEAVHNSAQSPSRQSTPETPPEVHNSAQPEPEYRPYYLHKPEPVQVQPKVGRNEPCPCHSGKKYKRCCLGKPYVRPEFVQRLASAV
jgi:preprotein translocase subunit SecA